MSYIYIMQFTETAHFEDQRRHNQFDIFYDIVFSL